LTRENYREELSQVKAHSPAKPQVSCLPSPIAASAVTRCRRFASRADVASSREGKACDASYEHLITHVATTEAIVTDVEMAETIHTLLDDVGLLAGEHFADRGCADAKLLAASVSSHGAELTGPLREDVTW
jgi:hypothetical protein